MKYKYNDQWLELPLGTMVTKKTDTPNGCILVDDNQVKVYDDSYTIVNTMRNGHSLLIATLNEAGAALNDDASFTDMRYKIMELKQLPSTPVGIKSATVSSNWSGADPNVVCDGIHDQYNDNSVCWYPTHSSSGEYIILELYQESIVKQMTAYFWLTGNPGDQQIEVLGGTDVNDMRSIIPNSENYTVRLSHLRDGDASSFDVMLDTGGQPIRYIKMIYTTVAHKPSNAIKITEFKLLK